VIDLAKSTKIQQNQGSFPVFLHTQFGKSV